jgi:ATP-dependent RNA helicase SUPV3L1/SUV3
MSPAADAENAAPLPAHVAAEPGDEIAQDQPAKEPVLIEVWRPDRAGRPGGRRGPRSGRRAADKGKGAPQGPDDAVAPAVAAAAATASPPTQERATTAPPEAARHHRQHRRHEPNQRFDRPPRERERAPVKSARFERREREKAPDPNSPFAKLAALKAQLEADAKERH